MVLSGTERLSVNSGLDDACKQMLLTFPSTAPASLWVILSSAASESIKYSEFQLGNDVHLGEHMVNSCNELYCGKYKVAYCKCWPNVSTTVAICLSCTRYSFGSYSQYYVTVQCCTPADLKIHFLPASSNFLEVSS